MVQSRDEAAERERRANNLRFKGVAEQQGEDVGQVVEAILKELGLVTVSKKIKESAQRLGREIEDRRRPRDILVEFAAGSKLRSHLLGKQEEARKLGFAISEDYTRSQMEEMNKIKAWERWERSLILFAPRLWFQSDEQDEEELRDHVASVIYDGLGYKAEEFDMEWIVETERLQLREPVFGKPEPIRIVFKDKSVRDEVFRWKTELKGFYRLEEPRKPRQRN
ncbi:hypothetical protein SELMODRAFT_419198 [Selaginella moellendorffii]|uniref:Uncharacterized protein n=1 Tax=Selaginella moellendorffii TaxID=88036 RepID=D8S858_SELML|nr:hypothetical protein SELMODRAFT_419198 [Selaginella moellendorffii]